MADALKTCDDFRDAPEGCCGSCHEDWSEGYDAPVERYDASGNLTHEVCCAVAFWLEKVERNG